MGARVRRLEVSLWLQYAEKQISVDQWIVLDDDDLLQSDPSPKQATAKKFGVQVSDLYKQEIESQARLLSTREEVEGSRAATVAATASVAISQQPLALPPVASVSNADDMLDDDPW